ncbi:MAG: Fe-S cluster assembly protein SufD [Gemmatimonadota bacterium]
MTQRYLDQHARFVAANSGAPDWVTRARRAGIERFAALGFPTTKDEDWHFTSPAPIAEAEFTFDSNGASRTAAADVEPFRFGDAGWVTMVFVNGRLQQDLSMLSGLGPGVTLLPLSAASAVPELDKRVGSVLSDQPTFTALNTAFMPDGAALHVIRDVKVRVPVHLVFIVDSLGADRVVYPRNLLVLERGAQATVVESYIGLTDARYFTNAVTEVSLGDGATLNHIKVQRESRRAYHVGTTEAIQGRDSHFVSFSFAIGGALTRTNIHTKLDGPGCGATLNGLYMLDGEQHCDHQTKIEHVAPNCFSREVYKGVLDGKSHGVFNGKVYVHPEAQKTDGKQTNNTLLLSKDAQMDTKPQLEIFADDVKCTHGATVGKLDEMALFYMKSRGVDAEMAKRLLIYAFAADVLETIANADVKLALERDTLARFVAEGREPRGERFA